ncbi:hypothetical protein HK105_204227 [Polyrhizophydium stewartii]|uniref:Uncharacterized protein n=1 Tax=Polyrhizophydium stewartii TaxID=2732419 RepID=A0ABR4N9C4_9FUNG|nr:hypothetical protein HK105_006673 [Polyrhizophydium stewartii]
MLKRWAVATLWGFVPGSFQFPECILGTFMRNYYRMRGMEQPPAKWWRAFMSGLFVKGTSTPKMIVKKRYTVTDGISITLMTPKAPAPSSAPPLSSAPPPSSALLPLSAPSRGKKPTKPSPDSNGDYIQNAPGLKKLEDGGFKYFCFFDLNSKNNAMIWIARMHLYHDLVGGRSWTKYDGKRAPNGTLFIKISKREFKQTRRIKWQQRVLQELPKREHRQRERDGKNDIFADMPSIKSTSVGDVWALFNFLAADGQTAANNMEGAGCRFEEMTRYSS